MVDHLWKVGVIQDVVNGGRVQTFKEIYFQLQPSAVLSLANTMFLSPVKMDIKNLDNGDVSPF